MVPSVPLGRNRDPRRRFWFHHLPLTVASAVLLTAFMRLPLFDVNAYQHADVSSGMFPRRRAEVAGAEGHGAGTRANAARQGDRTDHYTIGTSHHAGHGGEGHGGASAVATRHGGAGAEREHTVLTGERAGLASSRNMQQLTMATGYLGVLLLAVTLLLGPANLLLRRRNPVSSYLRRDVGIWAAIFSAIHVTAAVLIHITPGSGVAATVLHFFVNENGRVLTNSFGLGNWSGLAALVIAVTARNIQRRDAQNDESQAMEVGPAAYVRPVWTGPARVPLWRAAANHVAVYPAAHSDRDSRSCRTTLGRPVMATTARP